MKSKFKIVFIAFFLSLFFLACQKDYKYENRFNLLTKRTWQVKTFINYTENQTLITKNAKYYFKENNELIKIYENNEIVSTIWQLSKDSNFLIIGNNTFKITELNRKVMSLRYGDVEIFFIPIKE
ncbi:MAG: hypothetical protein GX793_00835 [Bacteroidales bacterium]|jgi:hypothetical protein|nr:hypothetical protein [Bacteroidales bacterium]MCK9499200.1 hypothetical protein [Bacteroidales bacterium]MDY0314671.1 hypothetical protein [Bacteroidales bacterium]NLB85585.1 hypothetical protein [Bacteroidales bacterium]